MYMDTKRCPDRDEMLVENISVTNDHRPVRDEMLAAYHVPRMNINIYQPHFHLISKTKQPQ